MKILIIAPPRCGTTSLLINISKLSDYVVTMSHPHLISIPSSSWITEKQLYPFNIINNSVIKIVSYQLSKNDGKLSNLLDFIDSAYRDYDKIILLNRRNEKEHFESYVNLSVRFKNNQNPNHPWFFQDIENKLSTVLLNEITLYRTVINKLSSELSIPMIYYEDLYGDDRNKSLEIIKSWKLGIDNNKLNECLHPKFRYRQPKNKDII